MRTTNFVETATLQELTSEFLAAATNRELRAVVVHGFQGSGKTENIDHFLREKLSDRTFAAKCSMAPLENSEIIRGNCSTDSPIEEQTFDGFEQVSIELHRKSRLKRKGLRVLNLFAAAVLVDMEKLGRVLVGDVENRGRFQHWAARKLENIRNAGTGVDAHVSQLLSKPKKGRPLVVYIDNAQVLSAGSLQLIRRLIAEQQEGTWGVIVLEYHGEPDSRPQPILWQLVKNNVIKSVFVHQMDGVQMRRLLKGEMGESFFTQEELEQLALSLDGNPGKFFRTLRRWEARELVEKGATGWKRSCSFGQQILKQRDARFVDEFMARLANDNKIDERDKVLLETYRESLGLNEARAAELEKIGHFLSSHPQFEFVRYVRRGMLGNVYEGRDKKTGREILIEIERRIEIGRKQRTDVTVPAVEQGRTLKTPFLHVLAVDDRSAGSTVVVTEHAGGFTLAELTTYFALSNYQTCLEAAKKLLSRLHSLHAVNKWHGQLRPEGVIYNPGNETMSLVEFITDSPTTVDVTDVHSYLAPEQVGTPPSVYVQSDVFASGVLLHQMLTGREPWAALPGKALRNAILTHPLQQDSDYPIVKGVFDILSRSLQKGHFDRYESARSMMSDIEKASHHLPVRPSSVRPRQAQKKLLMWKALVPIALVLIGLGLFYAGKYRLGSESEADRQAGSWTEFLSSNDSGKAVPDGTGDSTGKDPVRKLDKPPEALPVREQLGSGSKYWFLVAPFEYDQSATDLVLKNSLEYLLAFRLAAGVSNLVVTDQGQFDRFAKSQKAVTTDNAYKLSGKVTQDQAAPTATLVLELTLRFQQQVFTEQFRLEASDLLKLEKLKDGGWETEFTKVFRWLTSNGHHWDLTEQAKVPLAMLLTPNWKAFENFYSAEIAWQNLSVGRARSKYATALYYDDEFVLAHLGRAEVLAFGGEREKATAELLKVRKLLRASEKDQEAQLRMLPADRKMQFEALVQRLIARSITGEEQIRSQLARRFRFLPSVHYDLAEVYFHSGRCKEAVDEYNLALKYNPEFPKALNHRAYCFAYQGQFKDALTDLGTYTDIVAEADRTNAFDSMGDILSFQGKYPAALEYKTKACQSGDADYLELSRAKILVLMGRGAKARTIYTRMSKKAGTSGARARTQLAYLDYLAGDLAGAKSHLEAVAEAYPRPSDEEMDALDPALVVTTPFRSKATRVYRHVFFYDYWVEPLWLDGLIAYTEGDRGRLELLSKFLYKEVRMHYKLLGDELFRPVTKYHRHLRALRMQLEGAKDLKLEYLVESIDTSSARFGYWTSMYDRSFFYTEYARLALEHGDIPLAQRLLVAVLGDKDSPPYNPNYVPAMTLLARLRAAEDDVAGARNTLREAQTNLARWKSDDDSYLSSLVSRVATDHPGVAVNISLSAAR